MGPAIDPKMRYSQEMPDFYWQKLSYISVCFNNDCVITQRPKKCVGN